MTVREGRIEWPDLKRYSDIPIFNTKAAVQQTGVPAPTLRAWERRYAILSPERGQNDYRLYSERDIVTVHWLKERVDSGMSISHAIALFRHMSAERRQLEETQTYFVEHGSAFPMSLPDDAIEQEHISTNNNKQDEATSSIEDWLGTEVESVQSNYPVIYNMGAVREYLLAAFKVLDEVKASRLMASMLTIYRVEQVCTELITPTMWQIGQLWEKGEISVSVEHFASAFLRGLLTNLFHIAPDFNTGPLVIVCCAPGEPHELGALMLSLFLRRRGVRVAYLGQNIEVVGLLETIQQLAPALVCVSLTMPAYLASLIDLGRQIEAMPAPRPIFAFGGQIFTHYARLVSQVPGVHLSGDMKDATMQLQRMIAERTESLRRSE